MNFAPDHDWKFYEESVTPLQRERIASLSEEQRFENYLDYFDTLRDAKLGLGDQAALDRVRWEEKLTLRAKLVQIYNVLEKSSGGKITSKIA